MSQNFSGGKLVIGTQWILHMIEVCFHHHFLSSSLFCFSCCVCVCVRACVCVFYCLVWREWPYSWFHDSKYQIDANVSHKVFLAESWILEHNRYCTSSRFATSKITFLCYLLVVPTCSPSPTFIYVYI